MFAFQLPRWPESSVTSGREVDRLWRDWSPGLDLGAPAVEQALNSARALLRSPANTASALACYRGLLRAGRLGAWPARLRSALALTRTGHVQTVVAYGTDDGCIGAELFRGLDRRENLTVIRLDDAGHFLALERGDELADRIHRAIG